jgi:alanine racemase
VEQCEQYDIIPVIHAFEQLVLLRALKKRKKRFAVAIKCDSGMARLGFSPEDAGRLVERLRGLPGVLPVLAVSHLASADTDDGADSIRAQAAVFVRMLASLRRAWPDIAVSLCNSAGLLQVGSASEILGRHSCRAGITLYGGNPMHGTGLASLGKGLKTAMSVCATVIAVRTLKPGEGTGYGHTFVAREAMRIGIIAAGYSNYLSRSLSNRGCICAGGTRARILGRVSMEMTAIDLSNAPQIGVGDTVWLLGGPHETGVTPEELADAWGAVSYEVFCLLGGNPRVYTVFGDTESN